MARRKIKSLSKHYVGMEWADIAKESQKNAIPLLMSKDRWAVEAGREADLCNGDASAAIITAALCLEKWDASSTADKAIKLYEGIYKRSGSMGGHNFNEMRYWAAWSRSGPKNKKWPVVIPDWDDEDKWAGLANVMLKMASVEMAEDGSNTSLLGAVAICKFLEEGMEKKRAIA